MICIFAGFFFNINVEATSDTTGMQAKKTPLSEAVVLLIPMVSPMKYINGLNNATINNGFRGVFVN